MCYHQAFQRHIVVECLEGCFLRQRQRCFVLLRGGIVVELCLSR
jgi:hypothetical protein